MTVLATHGWDRDGDDSFTDVAVTTLGSKFTLPLQKAGIDTSLLLEEWKDMVDYSKRYLNLVQEPYQVICGSFLMLHAAVNSQIYWVW